jgi:anthranilate synthase component 2
LSVLILDNYDSFTYNLLDYIATISPSVAVKRNDEICLDDVEAYSHIVLSPGPKLPKDAGCMFQLIRQYVNTKKILGVCLGMQAIGEHFGGQLYNLAQPQHGMETSCQITANCSLFAGVPSPFRVGLYHSWALRNAPSPLEVVALSETGVVMAIQHKTLPIFGCQFHPESVLTPMGKKIIENFINL